MKTVLPILFSFLIVSTTFAQEGPPPPQGDGQGGNPPERRDGPPGMRRGMQDGMGPRMGGMGGPGGGMGGMGARPEMAERMRTVEMLRGYLDLVDHFSRLAHDPTSTGIAAVITAGDILKARGADAAIDFYNKLLPDVKDPAVGRAIRIQLADLYKNAGQADKALEQLHMLIVAEPAK